MSIQQAKLVVHGATPIPQGATIVAYLDRHPVDKSGGGAVIRFPNGHEAFWDGCAVRSIGSNWRRLVSFEEVPAQ